jgi:hypothetical protein
MAAHYRLMNAELASMDARKRSVRRALEQLNGPVALLYCAEGHCSLAQNLDTIPQ